MRLDHLAAAGRKKKAAQEQKEVDRESWEDSDDEDIFKRIDQEDQNGKVPTNCSMLDDMDETY